MSSITRATSTPQRRRATGWLGATALVVALLIVVALVPTATLGEFLRHPAHPIGTPSGIAARAVEGAQWLRAAAAITALLWIAGALVLLRARSDRGGEGESHEDREHEDQARDGARARSRDELTQSPRARPRDAITLPPRVRPRNAFAHPPRVRPRDAFAHTPRVRPREALAVAAIVLLGFALRIPFLLQSLWFDEIAAIGDFTKFGAGPIVGAWFTPSNHVLQSLLSWASATVFDARVDLVGGIEGAVRLPSLIAGLLTIVAVYALGRRLGGAASDPCVDGPASGRRMNGVTLGLTAAIVVALMPIAVLESTEARGYALAIFFTAVGCWAFVRGMQEGEPWPWIVVALCGALATWSHFVASLATVGLALVASALLVAPRLARGGSAATSPERASPPPADAATTRRLEHARAEARALPSPSCEDARTIRRRACSCLVAACMAGALALTLIAPLLPDLLASRGAFQSRANETPLLLSAEGLRLLLMLGGTWAAALPPLLAAIPGMILFGLGLAASLRDSRARVTVIAALAGLPLAILIPLGGSWIYARFASFMVPGVAITIALGLVTAYRWHRRAGLVAAGALAAAFTLELILLPPRQPIRSATDALAQRARPGDIAIDVGLRGNVSGFYFPRDTPILATGILGEGIESRSSDPRVRWAIVTYPEAIPAERRAALERAGFTLEQQWNGWIDWGRGAVQLWHRGAPTGPAVPTSR